MLSQSSYTTQPSNGPLAHWSWRSSFNMSSFESMVNDDVDIEIDAIVRRNL